MNHSSTGNLQTKLHSSLQKDKNFYPFFVHPNSKVLGNGNSIKGVTSLLDALLIRGIIDMETYNSIKFQSINTNTSIEEILVQKGILSSNEIFMMYSEIHGIPFVDLSLIDIPLDVLNIIPKDVAEKFQSVPFYLENNLLFVACIDPLDLQKINYLQNISKKKIKPCYVAPEQLKLIIDTKYSAQITKEVEQALEEFDINSLTLDIDKIDTSSGLENIQNAPIVKIVNRIMEYAVSNKSSDIHIEPRENKISVRFRINGILSEKLVIPKTLQSALITRIKILCSAKIDEHRIPQDGRFQIKTKDLNYVDVRVSIVPTIYGEKVVMRLLEKKQVIRTLKDLGIFGVSLRRLESNLKKTQGIILVTGPTGSGKTQTLASCLKILNTPEVNILTLEDPVEIRIDGVNQVQINPEVGLTFASGLRSFLRQDPDIIMVGELRDSESASLAIQAALVGRLVLSTIHTNSAAGAFVRLIDMGIEPFLIASTVNLILAQRLVRTLCDACKEKYSLSKIEVQEIKNIFGNLLPFQLKDDKGNILFSLTNETDEIVAFRPKGCYKCNQTGFNGRTGIFEALQMSENISKLILKKATMSEIHDLAVQEGM
ncbi:MAG: ATPase, T2SS/T4P/T4SS family, partial [Candidatus Dojkabacteria bacterium]|nr:ATPase, T2SS/T4P/T4SS family [Candidatus Dojkabacteria bacterium]